MNKQPNSEMCFICGRSNPVGLYMRFQDDGEHTVVSHYTVPSHYQGYPGIVHGGIQAAMLDEVVGRVAMIGDHHHFMMSVTLDVKYRHPVPVGVPLKISGHIVRLRGRLGRARGMIELPDGTLACEAALTLADVPRELLAQTNPELLNWNVD
ncbi:PaaI family thioesterase [Elongatibacter sediminis]|uniref:Acyl-coenzyme A thioesterase THEM4 n=1 Tax=Elongatibacter sediminis TaxID=3119006 RepID=A0AAW9RLS8_9GAMM